MMNTLKHVTFLLFLTLLGSGSGNEEQVFKRFDYKYSFKGPYLAQPDGTIPFWEKRGNTLPSDHSIRLTPSLRNQRGALWSKNKTTFEWWEVELVFRTSGRGRTGGDGIAFWYLEQKPGEGVTGSVFGGPDGPWTGLAILWDSYDNNGKFDNPCIMAFNNKGSFSYDQANDGEGQHIGYCQRDFRNKPFPLKARIRYHNQALSLYFNNGMNKGEIETDFELCFQLFNVELPFRFGYLGISGSTATVADDQDIYKFLTSSIREVSNEESAEHKAEREQLEKEYQTYQEKLQKQKEEYKQQHPEHQEKPGEDVDDDNLDEIYDKEFKKVLEEQRLTQVNIQHLSTFLDKIGSKHEQISGAIDKFRNSIPSNGSLALADSVFQRFEVDNILESNKELSSVSLEIKRLTTLMEEKMKGNFQAPAEIPGIPPDDPNTILQEVVHEIVSLQSRVKTISSQMEGETSTECSKFCISTKSYVIFSSVSTMVVLCYLMYKDYSQYHSSMTASKKFY